jgi:hypothetical protein
MLTWCLVDLHFSVACIRYWSLGGVWGTGIHVPGTEQGIMELFFGLRIDGRGGIGWMATCIYPDDPVYDGCMAGTSRHQILTKR